MPCRWIHEQLWDLREFITDAPSKAKKALKDFPPKVDAATIDIGKDQKVSVEEASADESDVEESKKKKKKAIGFRERRVNTAF